jgi:acyl phosphate:glycerol-3-phosphate acyltransferase
MALWISLHLLLFLLAYVLGAMPFGYWLGWLFKGIDIRDYGSRSTGATNALRVLGKGPALLIFIADILKAAVAVLFVRACYTIEAIAQYAPSTFDLQQWLPWVVCLVGLTALIGHSKSIFLMVGSANKPGYSVGGKSAASGLGVLFAISWVIGLLTLGIFLSVLAVSRYVSVSSMAAGIGICILMIATNQPFAYSLFAVVASIYIIVRHRANIQRLIEGTEPKVGKKLTPVTSE